MYMAGLILFPAYKIWPRLANRSKWAGLPIMAIALIAASFANNVNDLIVTQGVMFAVGGSIVYFPALVFLDEWFIERKGVAFGIMWASYLLIYFITISNIYSKAGTGAAGLVIPFIMNFLLNRYGFRITLRVWALALLIIASPLIYFLRPRLHTTSVPRATRYGLGFLRTTTFWLLQVGLIMESLGYFIPSIYLPTFARSLGLSSSMGTLLVALVNAASVLSTILMGMLIDRFDVTTVILLSTVGTVLSVFLFWGFSDALPLLIVFSVLYGFFAGGFVSTNAGVIKAIKALDETTDVGILIACLSAGRGIGAVVSGPLSEALLNAKPWQGKASFGYGSGYGGLIVFTGSSAALGAASFLGKHLGWM
jgi:cyanate permease